MTKCYSKYITKLARSHTFVEIDHEIISTVILLPSAESFKKGCCQYVHEVLVNCLFKLVQERTDRPAMTITVDLGRKATKTNKNEYDRPKSIAVCSNLK